MHVITGVTACLEVSPCLSPCLGQKFLFLVRLTGLTAPGDSPVHISHLALGVMGLQIHPVVSNSRDPNTVSHTWKRLCPLGNLPSASVSFLVFMPLCGIMLPP